MLGNFLLTDVEGPLLLLPVPGHGPLILLRGHPKHGAQRSHYGLILHHGIALQTFSVFDPLGRFNNDALSGFHLNAFRIEIVLLSAAFKTDAYNFCHWGTSYLF